MLFTLFILLINLFLYKILSKRRQDYKFQIILFITLLVFIIFLFILLNLINIIDNLNNNKYMIACVFSISPIIMNVFYNMMKKSKIMEFEKNNLSNFKRNFEFDELLLSFVIISIVQIILLK